MKLKEVLKPALILCVICLLATAALAGTNMLTADTIAQQKVITEQESRKQVLPDADSFEETDGYAIGKTGSDVAGYVFVTSAKGYGGDVQVMTGHQCRRPGYRRCDSGAERDSRSWQLTPRKRASGTSLNRLVPGKRFCCNQVHRRRRRNLCHDRRYHYQYGCDQCR